MKKANVIGFKEGGKVIESVPIYFPMEINVKVRRTDKDYAKINLLYEEIKPGDKLHLEFTLKSEDRNAWVLTAAGKKVGSYDFEPFYHYSRASEGNAKGKCIFPYTWIHAMSLIQDRLVITVTEVMPLSTKPRSCKYAELNGVLDIMDRVGTKKATYTVEDAGSVERDPF